MVNDGKSTLTLWTKEEDKLLLNYYLSCPPDVIKRLLPTRTWGAIKARARKLGFFRFRRFNVGNEPIREGEVNREYLAGLFDSDGCVSLGINQCHRGWRIQPMAVISQKYIAGLFDGDGCIYACATHNGNSYVFRTNLQMLLRRKPFEVLYEIKGFLARKGIHATVRKRPSHHSRSGEELVLYISSRTSVKRFLELLLPWLRVKRPQAIVMLTQIIPRLEKGEHLTRRGFLELMRWADVLTLLKGDTLEAKKYTYAYFLKIWGDENALSEPIFSNAKEKATK